MRSGTTAIVARHCNKSFIGIEIFQQYIDFANQRIKNSDNLNLELFILATIFIEIN
jgi:DNA modification methylase